MTTLKGVGMFEWESIGGYLDCLDRNGVATNVAMLVPQVRSSFGFQPTLRAGSISNIFGWTWAGLDHHIEIMLIFVLGKSPITGGRTL